MCGHNNLKSNVMKTSLVIFILLALSFAGKSEERATVAEKYYIFEYEDQNMFALPVTGLQWYHEMDLYIDGKFVQTIRIGNRLDMLLFHGFAVPVGSSWNLRWGTTVTTQNGSQIALRLSYNSSGLANDTSRGNIVVRVGPY